jgi:hypothetical protein
LDADYPENGVLIPRRNTLILDEAEGDQLNKRIYRVIELLRRMSSGTGAAAMRGSIDGVAHRFEVVGAAFMAAINPPDLKPQDRSRITEIELNAPGSDADPGTLIEAIARLGELCRRLWARAIAGEARFRANFATLRKQLIASGSDPRQADQAATLLAGYFMMVEDEPITEAVAAQELPRYRWMIQTASEEADESAANQCLQTILGSMVEAGHGGEKTTIGRLVVAAQGIGNETARLRLADYGIVVQQQGTKTCGAWIANRNPVLAKLLASTAWGDHSWGKELKRLDGAYAIGTPRNIGATKSRVTFLPLKHLPTPEANEQPPDPAA